MIKKIAFLLLFLSFGFLVWFVSFGLLKSPKKNILYHTPLQVGKQEIYVKVAKTLAEQAQGFSGSDPITNEQGMLFDFTNDPGIKTFWMKDMNFDLDLIWIRHQQIIGITANVPKPKKNLPANQLSLYTSPGVVDMVLEVNAQWSERNKIGIGDKVRQIKK